MDTLVTTTFLLHPEPPPRTTSSTATWIKMNELAGEVNRVRSLNVDDIVAEFPTYEDYLDSQITSTDLFYLEDRDLARQLVELGYRGHGEPLRRQEFEARKKAMIALQNPVSVASQDQKDQQEQKKGGVAKSAEGGAAGAGVKPVMDANSLLATLMQKKAVETPFLKQLEEREELIRQGKLASILFLRLFKPPVGSDEHPLLTGKPMPTSGHEISGYIDLSDRLLHESFQKYYDCKSYFTPRWSDMSYFDWESGRCVVNETTFFQVITEKSKGMTFRHKRDRKVVSCDPNANNAEGPDSVRRVVVRSPEYLQVVFYDHVIRRKS